MNLRQRQKTLREFERRYGLKPDYFRATARRRRAFLRQLERQLDDAFDAWASRYCR